MDAMDAPYILDVNGWPKRAWKEPTIEVVVLYGIHNVDDAYGIDVLHRDGRCETIRYDEGWASMQGQRFWGDEDEEAEIARIQSRRTATRRQQVSLEDTPLIVFVPPAHW